MAERRDGDSGDAGDAPVWEDDTWCLLMGDSYSNTEAEKPWVGQSLASLAAANQGGNVQCKFYASLADFQNASLLS